MSTYRPDENNTQEGSPSLIYSYGTIAPLTHPTTALVNAIEKLIRWWIRDVTLSAAETACVDAWADARWEEVKSTHAGSGKETGHKIFRDLTRIALQVIMTVTQEARSWSKDGKTWSALIFYWDLTDME